MSDGDIHILAGAFREVADTMKAVHAVFMRLAIVIPIIIVIFMVILSGGIVLMVNRSSSSSEERLIRLMTRQSDDISKLIQVNQTVTVQRQLTEMDLIREDMDRKRQNKEKPDD